MDAVVVTYFAMIVPVCLWLLAIVCWSVWWGMGRISYLAWYGGGAFFGGLALGVQTLTPPFTYSQWAPWVTPIYILAIVCLTQALSARLQVRMRRWWTVGVAIGIELLAIYFSWVDENLSARLTVLAVGLTILLLQLLPQLARLSWRTLGFADRGLILGYAAYTAFVVLRPALLAWDPDSFAKPFALGVSVIWLITLYGSMIMGIGFTGFFLAAAGLDSVQQLRHERDRDPLTGLLNRRALLAPWPELASCGAVVVMCDLDHFKRINDTWGHATGDAVLQAFGALLAAHVRPSDRVGRYGGEEFVLVLHGVTLATALPRLERIRAEVVGATAWPGLPAGSTVTLSLGAVALHAQEALEMAIVRADLQMYAAKQSGRNQICWGDGAADLASC